MLKPSVLSTRGVQPVCSNLHRLTLDELVGGGVAGGAAALWRSFARLAGDAVNMSANKSPAVGGMLISLISLRSSLYVACMSRTRQ